MLPRTTKTINLFKSKSTWSEYLSTNVRWNKNYLLSIVDKHAIHYPTPVNLTYAWSFGFLAAVSLAVQILSGIFLAMHYTPHIDLAFSSVEHIMRDVQNAKSI